MEIRKIEDFLLYTGWDLARRSEKWFPLLPGHLLHKGGLPRDKPCQLLCSANAGVGFQHLLQCVHEQNEARLKGSLFVSLMATIADSWIRKNKDVEAYLASKITYGIQAAETITSNFKDAISTALLQKKCLGESFYRRKLFTIKMEINGITA